MATVDRKAARSVRIFAIRVRVGLWLDGIGQIHQVTRCSKLTSTRWNQRKTQEHESPDQKSSIVSVFLEANDDMATAQNFFSILQQHHKTLLGSFWKDIVRDLDVQRVPNEQSFPDHLLTDQPDGEAQVADALSLNTTAMSHRS